MVRICQRLGIGMMILLLVSCQQNQDDNVTAKQKKLNDAAGFNMQLGLAYLKQGHIPRAKRKLLTALKQSPNSPDANAAMGYFMEKTGDVEKARSYYQKAMNLAPGSGSQLNNYGAFLCRQGEYLKAEDYFLKAVKDVQYDHTSGAYENAGLCALSVPDDAKAKQYFVKALSQDPSRKESLYELLKLEVKQNHYEDALNDLNKYSEIVYNTRVILALGIKVAHQLGKPELEANYNMRLSHLLETTGVKHDDNHYSG